MYIWSAWPICFRFDMQTVCVAFCFARASAGQSKPASIAMIAMTTRSSIRVKPRWRLPGGTTPRIDKFIASKAARQPRTNWREDEIVRTCIRRLCQLKDSTLPHFAFNRETPRNRAITAVCMLKLVASLSSLKNQRRKLLESKRIMFRWQSIRSRIGELPEILWACFPSHPTEAGAIHPLRPDVPGLETKR